MKDKVSIAIPPQTNQWLREVCKKTGESFSALVTRLLIEAQARSK